MLLEQAEVRCKQFQNCHFHHDIKNVILQAFVHLALTNSRAFLPNSEAYVSSNISANANQPWFSQPPF